VRSSSRCRLVDVLGEWGILEGTGRFRLPPHLFQGGDRLLNGVEVALTRRTPLVLRILAAQPISCFRVEIAPQDVPALRIFNGQKAAEWTASILRDQRDFGKTDATGEVLGPLTCTAGGSRRADGSVAAIVPPYVIFDGLHRSGAWIAQLRRGANYSISGNLIVTRDPVPMF
jgi:hypothetical protein